MTIDIQNYRLSIPKTIDYRHWNQATTKQDGGAHKANKTKNHEVRLTMEIKEIKLETAN
jgi:hypothetical protein